MHSIYEYNILYINLDSREDRRENIEQQLMGLGLFDRRDRITQRISGVVGKDLYDPEYAQSIADEFGVSIDKMTPEYWLSRKNFKTMSNNKARIIGQVGCYLGHLRAIKFAIENDLGNVIILEDDCSFLALRGTAITFPKPPSSTELFYLGGLFWHQTSTPKPLKSSEDHWIRIKTDELKVPCAFAYGFINRKTIRNTATLLQNVWKDGKGRDKPKDWRTDDERIRATALDFMFLNFIQAKGRAHIISNVKAVQSDAFISDVTDVGKKTPKKPYKHSYFYSS